jgi:CTP synthase
MARYVFVVGGVMSGVGKGAAAASIGRLLMGHGHRATAIKIDPYINVDAGTMNPVEHGEVFVTRDGDETDQDIGNYERFLDADITSVNYMTTGRVYQTVIERERNLEYGGKCVEVVPHIPLEVLRRFRAAEKNAKADVVIVEIGGTVGEYQNVLFLEALRMLKLERPKDVVTVLVSYLPIPTKTGEMKTKPTQHAARLLNASGIQPDFILARADVPVDEPRRRKLSVFCGVAEEDVISAPDVDSIYQIPLNFEAQAFGKRLMRKLGLRDKGQPGLGEWQKLVDSIAAASKPVRLAIVGKYFGTGDFTLADSYLSVIEALKHAAWRLGVKPRIDWLNSEDFERPGATRRLAQYDGILIPGGFGTRGVEGKISAIRYAREKRIPYFGLCYGMQMAVVEFARHVAGIKEATTEEMDETAEHRVIHFMPDQERLIRTKQYGGSMRLGEYPCALVEGTRSRELYGAADVGERHRHRYEFNNDYRERLAARGLVIAGTSPAGDLVEIIELADHPFFVGVQFHPEFQSRPLHPHPLFMGFVEAALKRSRERR